MVLKRIKLFIILICLSVWSLSCESASEKRRYVEIVLSPPESKAPDLDPHAGIPNFGQLKQQFGGQISGSQDMSQMPKGNVASGPSLELAWDVPEGWDLKVGKGIRLVTFNAGKDHQTIECTVISLGGDAGGLEANVTRWMQQVNIPTLKPHKLKRFLKKQQNIITDGGIPGVIIDLTKLQSKKDNLSASILAAIMTLEDKTIFVKMKGSRGAVVNNQQKFLEFCQSIRKP